MATLAELALEHQLPYLHLERYRAENESVALVAYELAKRMRVLPLFCDEGRLALAVVRPDDLTSQDYISRLTGLDVLPVLVEDSALSQALIQYYVAEGQSGLAWGKRASQALDRNGSEVERNLNSGREAPVARLFEQLVAQAIQLRASDLHLETSEGQPRLRYRIDGVLNDFTAPPAAVYPALISRIKILANLDISEKRRPQDGRISLDGRELRVSIIPYLDGEGAVIRILGAGAGVLSLEQVGFAQDMLARYRRVVRRSHGLLLVTGPTGAGKTTTLYASLAEISTPKRKLVTLEDPVEYRLPGVCQIPIRPEVDFTFADGLRSVLRHDPDVLMIGEIRDRESAEIAIRASLTGHLIFATLHTNTAAQAVTRLIDMGIPPYHVMTSLVWVLAQRLLRRLCPACKQPCTQARIEPWLHLETSQGFEAQGCEQCGGLGYLGRLPAYEYLEVSDAMRCLPADGNLAQAIDQTARLEGFISAKERALQLFQAGLTSLEEIESLILEA
ncbi:type II/IV secretion system protein [bacterium]|nr:type II/IV secretion system protein [bacterium]